MQSADRKVAQLGQRYDEAQIRLQNVRHMITHTREIVAAASAKVATDRSQLEQVALQYYVNNGAAASANPLFSNNESSVAAANLYRKLAEGNLSASVASLRNSSIILTSQRQILRAQLAAAGQASRAANTALRDAQRIQSNIHRALANVSSVISGYIARAKAAAEARALANWRKHHHGQTPGRHNGFPLPPPNSRANIAVRAALHLLGVPYVWGGASRYGVDCSGLVMLAWDAAGVSLPHFSGAQYNDTIRIPLWALRPGDLLFYGWHGDEHVTMYIGHGEMVEAPYTGQVVHITPVRLDYGFAGAGRVR